VRSTAGRPCWWTPLHPRPLKGGCRLQSTSPSQALMQTRKNFCHFKLWNVRIYGIWRAEAITLSRARRAALISDPRTKRPSSSGSRRQKCRERLELIRAPTNWLLGSMVSCPIYCFTDFLIKSSCNSNTKSAKLIVRIKVFYCFKDFLFKSSCKSNTKSAKLICE